MFTGQKPMERVFEDPNLLPLIKFSGVNRLTRECDKKEQNINKALVKKFIQNVEIAYHDKIAGCNDWWRNLNKKDPLRTRYTIPARIYWNNIGTYNEIRFGDLKLYLSNNSIEVLLELIEDNLHVTGSLDLRNNSIGNLPENFINRFTIGHDLYLSQVNLEILPINFGKINVGNNIDLSNNRIEDLPESIKDLKINGSLDLSNNGIGVLSETFSGINLGALDLSNNYIEDLPESIKDLKINGSLNLSNNQIRVLSETFSGINLGALDLSNNQIRVLSETFSGINLGALDLSKNLIRFLPKTFGEIKIKHLNLSGNQIESLPDTFWSIDFSTLDLRNNYLEYLPEIHDNFEIIHLNLSNNQLKKLPTRFGAITVIGNLDLSNNKLKRLPKKFGAINVGGNMYLCNNKLKKIPLSFSKGHVGGILYLNYNLIDDLDERFRFSGIIDLSNNSGVLSGINEFSNNGLKSPGIKTGIPWLINKNQCYCYWSIFNFRIQVSEDVMNDFVSIENTIVRTVKKTVNIGDIFLNSFIIFYLFNKFCSSCVVNTIAHELYSI